MHPWGVTESSATVHDPSACRTHRDRLCLGHKFGGEAVFLFIL